MCWEGVSGCPATLWPQTLKRLPSPLTPLATSVTRSPSRAACSLAPVRLGREEGGKGGEKWGGAQRERERMDSSKQKLYPVCESLHAPYSLAEESDRTLQRDSVKEAVDVL